MQIGISKYSNKKRDHGRDERYNQTRIGDFQTGNDFNGDECNGRNKSKKSGCQKEKGNRRKVVKVTNQYYVFGIKLFVFLNF